jgi:hypothetical protein
MLLNTKYFFSKFNLFLDFIDLDENKPWTDTFSNLFHILKCRVLRKHAFPFLFYLSLDIRL